MATSFPVCLCLAHRRRAATTETKKESADASGLSGSTIYCSYCMNYNLLCFNVMEHYYSRFLHPDQWFCI